MSYCRTCELQEDNLQFTGSTVTHHGVTPTSDEEITPTLENVTVLLWLEKLHVSLPGLIKQRYGSELCNKSLSSIKSEISLALTSLIEEVKSSDDIKVGRTFHSDNRSRRSQSRVGNNNNDGSRKEKSRRSGNKFCCLCRASNRPDWDSHYLSTCKYVPDADRKAFSK